MVKVTLREPISLLVLHRPSLSAGAAVDARAQSSQPMATKPLRPAATPGRLPRRRRRPPLARLGQYVATGLAFLGAVALVLLVLGLLGVRAVTEHFRLH